MTAGKMRQRVRRDDPRREEEDCPDKDNPLTSAEGRTVWYKDQPSMFVRARARARTNIVPLAAVDRRER